MKKIELILTTLIFPFALSAQESLSLEQCRSLALEHNQKMKMAKEQVNAAEAVKKSAFTQYLPNFSVNGVYTYLNKDYQLLKNDMFLPVVPYTAIDATTGGINQAALATPAVAASTFVINPATGAVVTDASGNPVFQKYTYLPASKSTISLDNLYVINGGFMQPVYLGGKIRETNKIAAYVKEVADHNLSLTENELMYSVEETYWRIVSLREKVKMAENYQQMLKRLVSDLENIHSEGIITNNDLLKARLKLSESDIMLLKAKNGMEISKMVLCQMTGVTYSSGIFLTDSLNQAEPSVLNYTVNEDGITERPELKILEKNVDIAQSGIKIMQSRYLPNIMLNAGYTSMNPNPYNGLAEEFGSDWNVGVVCNIPIFHFGDKKHTLNAAKAEHNAAILKLEETKELLVLQLQQAVYGYTESTKKTEYAELALEQSKQNLNYTLDNFKEGVLKTTDVLEAQVLWQKAYSELIDARTDQQMAVSNLKKVTGKY
ncbi:MAG: TolC family protein [Bacteroidales bacterium]|nr:TolC family protein [Bacteroidales bacterium]